MEFEHLYCRAKVDNGKIVVTGARQKATADLAARSESLSIVVEIINDSVGDLGRKWFL